MNLLGNDSQRTALLRHVVMAVVVRRLNAGLRVTAEPNMHHLRTAD
jgi:hypothetical protein